MTTSDKNFQDNVFRVYEPDTLDIPVVVDSPHSGQHYPDDFKYECSQDDLRQGEDTFVNQLFHRIPEEGGYFLEALFSRSYIDPNRSEKDIDPIIVEEDWTGPISNSERASHGMGLIQRKIRPNLSVFTGTLSTESILRRIDDYYKPYHHALHAILDTVHNKFSRVLLINAHATPSRALDGHQHSDIIIGDRKGQTCSKDVRRALVAYFQDHGFKVAVNDPYQGVEIVRRYGQPTQNRHAVQIEINKALYMNETTYEKTDDFKAVQDIMMGCAVTLGAYLNE